MSFQLSFDQRLAYDAGQAGITLPVTLRLSQSTVVCEARIDTGSTLDGTAEEVKESYEAFQ